MYRLLIVTRDPRVENMFESMTNWEGMGYRKPRVRTSVEDALECMQKHHVDAIAVEEDAALAPLNVYLDEEKPDLPIFQIKNNEKEQLTVLSEVYQLLTQTHADHSDDDYGEEYYFKLARERWIKLLMSGMAPTREHVLAHHRLFRCKESIDAPCVYARLSVPSGDVFLSGRWHYGSDRLEVALRNFFGNEHEKMTVHIAVISPEEVRVLACPKGDCSEQGVFGSDHVLSYIEETLEQIEQYLGLKMNVMDIRGMENIVAFSTGVK